MNSQEARRNPNWIRDELILALELYLSDRTSPPSKTSKAVADLSASLNRLNAVLGRTGNAEFRNPNGVYMKMMNFRRFDPEVTSSGHVGLTRGNKDEVVVWEEFASEPDHLRSIATAIQSGIDHVGHGELAPVQGEQIAEAEEGRLLTVLHVRRERNRKLVQKRREAALSATGRLQCEACDFDFRERYGDRGDGFIEVHHTRPLHTLAEGTKTRLDDLALVCANCHRIIHRTQKWLTIEELREVLAAVPA